MYSRVLDDHLLGNVEKSVHDFKIKVLYYGRGYQLFELLEDITFTLSDGSKVTAKAGLQIDGRSSPYFLRRFFPMFGKAARAWILHDLLYIIDYRREELGTYKARLLADREMLKLCKRLNASRYNIWSTWENYLSYFAVRIFGGKVYKKDRK